MHELYPGDAHPVVAGMIFFDPIAGLIHTPPICAVCERPVQSIETRHDLLTLEIVLVVRCHGEQEEARLGEEVIKLGTPKLSFGRAFTTKRIEAARKEIGPAE